MLQNEEGWACSQIQRILIADNLQLHTTHLSAISASLFQLTCETAPCCENGRMKMKTIGLIFSTFVVSALAAPAVVWKNVKRESKRALHSSDELKASDLLGDVLSMQPTDSSLAAVVFLVGRGEDGSEYFTELASSGKLPGIASKYDQAEGVYHQVSGIESTQAMVREASRANPGLRVLQVSLSEFISKLTSLNQPKGQIEIEIPGDGMISKAVKQAHKRARDISLADVLIVKVDPMEQSASEIDVAVVKAIDDKNVENVIVAGIRSLSEVKRERYLLSKRRMEIMEQEGERIMEEKRRRLEQGNNANQNGNNANQNGNNADMSGVYYVAMTPNILAGLLFGLLFTVVTWIGVTCMGAIAGQDVFVSKMPSIGREA